MGHIIPTNMTLYAYVALSLLLHPIITEAITQCQRSDQLIEPCKCLKRSDNEAVVICSGMKDEGDINKVFGLLFPNGDSYAELTIAHSEMPKELELPEQFANLQILKLDKLSGISVENILKLVKPLEKLQELVIINCTIPHLRGDAFGHKPELKVLFLDNNQIEHIEPGAFEKLPELHILSLERNKLRNLQFPLTPMTKLKDLFLSGNQIVGFSSDEVQMMEMNDDDDNNFKLHIDTLDCGCDSKDSPIVKLAKAKQMNTISCNFPESVQGYKVVQMTEELFCNSTPVLTGTLWLLLTLLLLL